MIVIVLYIDIGNTTSFWNFGNTVFILIVYITKSSTNKKGKIQIIALYYRSYVAINAYFFPKRKTKNNDLNGIIWYEVMFSDVYTITVDEDRSFLHVWIQLHLYSHCSFYWTSYLSQNIMEGQDKSRTNQIYFFQTDWISCWRTTISLMYFSDTCLLVK